MPFLISLLAVVHANSIVVTENTKLTQGNCLSPEGSSSHSNVNPFFEIQACGRGRGCVVETKLL